MKTNAQTPLTRLAVLAAVVLLTTACGTTPPTSQSAKDDYPLNDWKLGFLLDPDGSDLDERPEVCGAPIPASQVTVLDVQGEADPRAVVQRELPNAKFTQEDYLLVAIQRHPGQTRQWLRGIVATLGCDVLVIGDFENKRYTYDAADPKLRTMTLQAIWGTDGSRSAGP
ncbi:MAG: hypothetical protein V2I57_08905 [Xanthomonadales bacterium]|nr:hypothetical protein [Xanthomonadales bacterium]